MKALIIAGNGIRLAGEQQRFRAAVERMQIPFVTTWTGADLIPTDHPLNTGIIGMCGQPGANKAVQECDYLMALGTHLSIPQTTTLTDKFAPNAKIVVIDIDADQLANMNVRVDDPVCMGIKEWLDVSIMFAPAPEWLARCAELKEINAVGNPRASSGINSYVFNNMMTRMLPAGTCMVIDGGGTALYTGFQSSYVKEGSRLICSSSMSAMGSGLPEAVGACLANGKKLTTCLIGDGSLMLNIQELQTIFHLGLPIKIFVINNQGYLAIRHTQDGFLGHRHTGVGGSDDKSLSFAEVQRQSAAYRIPYFRITNKEMAPEIIARVLDGPSPVLCEVMCPPDQEMLWKQAFKQDGDRFIPQPLDEMVRSR